MNMIPVLARAFGVDPVAFERQVEAYEEKDRRVLDLRMASRAEALEAECRRLREAAIEVLEVADLRGDSELPHPANDPKLWTARMTDAWDALRTILFPDVILTPPEAQGRESLKPCPFCAAEMRKREEYVEPIGEHEEWCPLAGRTPFNCTTDAWNRRAPEAQGREEVGA